MMVADMSVMNTRKMMTVTRNLVMTGKNLLDTEKKALKFVSTEHRSIFRCEADEQALTEILNALKRMEVSEAMEGHWFSCLDKTRRCSFCGKRLVLYNEEVGTNSWRGNSRIVYLHTLIHGTVRVTVVDLMCWSCNTFHVFDGKDNALFSASEDHIYTREIMDLWVSEVCGMGKTFRQAFSTLMTFSSSTSVSMERKGLPLMCKRRFSCSAFHDYLSLLNFPADEVLARTFSCSTCEVTRENGVRYAESVVVDGTAVGLLCTLPNYARDEYFVPRFHDIRNIEFLSNALRSVK